MHSTHKALADLEEQVRQGIPGASTRLRSFLEPRMVPVIVLALRPGPAISSLTRRIRAVALQTAQSVGHRTAEYPPWLIGLIARRLCELLVDELRRGQSTHRGLVHTLCA
jgi:hypothetical protein